MRRRTLLVALAGLAVVVGCGEDEAQRVSHVFAPGPVGMM
jgi:hypothetical protein